MTDLAAHLQDYIGRNIPLTRALGVRVVRWDARGLVLGAPLAPNANDKGTAFAGSLATVVTLSAWGLAQLLATEMGHAPNVAITRSEIDYLRPVRGDFEAFCARPAAERIEALRARLESRGRARFECEAVIEAAGETAVRFAGTFAVSVPGAG